MSHVMLDLETLGTAQGSIILSIGAAVFFPQGKGHTETFYRNIDPVASKNLGFTTDPETVAWWQKQSEEAKESLVKDRIPPDQALADFSKFFYQVGGEQLWCQGANFDEPMLSKAYKILGRSIPWKFFNVRDTRTVYDICRFDTRSLKRLGTYHNALDDCKYQIECVQKAIQNARF